MYFMLYCYIHVLYKYETDLIATDKCYSDVTVYFCGPQGWMQCLWGEDGAIRVAVISISRVQGPPG